MQRIILSQADFEALVSGKIITKGNGVQIALSDIGYLVMKNFIDKKVDELYGVNE